MSGPWISRRGFLRLAGFGLVGALAATLRGVAGRLAALQPRARLVTVPLDGEQEVTFLDDVIVCRANGAVHVLSSRCTHLGCRITQQADGLLVCPCHGSRFRLDGTVARGPAARPLEPLPYRVDRSAGTMVVQAS